MSSGQDAKLFARVRYTHMHTPTSNTLSLPFGAGTQAGESIEALVGHLFPVKAAVSTNAQ